METPPKDSTESDVQTLSGASRKRVVRRVAKPREVEAPTQPVIPIDNAVKIEEPVEPELRSPAIFRCIKCATMIPEGSDLCPKCGTAYVREEISAEAEEAEIDAELALDDSFEDVSPLFEQDDLGCGYFDVDHGIVAYVEPRRVSKDVVYECLNCKTILEFEAERCPFCREPLKKIDDGIVEIVNGVIVGEDLDMEISKDIFCPICGDLLALDNGHCIVCETELVSNSDESLSSLLPVVPSNNLVFLHLDVENGDLNYLSNSKDSPQEVKLAPPVDESFDDVPIWSDESENKAPPDDKEGRLD
jgi:RNA polymerase subunit RPABC4/transcription elongation factor Spt4